MNAPRPRPTVDADLAEALAAITHLDIRHFRRANDEVLLDHDVAGSLPWDAVTDAELDAMERELAFFGTVSL